MNTAAAPSDCPHRRLVMAVLEQAPPPSLREILGAYRSKGDGDRDLLIAMLNAKSAEEQRIAAIASLHSTLLDLYAAEAKAPPTPYPPHLNSPPHKRRASELSSGHESFKSAPFPRELPHQPQSPRKRQRHSRSPAATSRRDARSSRDLPPSPYSSRSDSEEYSPRSRASMAIGSLLSSAVGRDAAPDESENTPEVPQTRFPPVGVSV